MHYIQSQERTPNHSDSQRQQATQASLRLAHSQIQQGNTTGALQVSCSLENQYDWNFMMDKFAAVQVVFELLREISGEAAVHSAAER